MADTFPAYLQGMERLFIFLKGKQGLARSQPTYKGWKGRKVCCFPVSASRSQPTYKGWKEGDQRTLPYEVRVFPAYLQGMER